MDNPIACVGMWTTCQYGSYHWYSLPERVHSLPIIAKFSSELHCSICYILIFDHSGIQHTPQLIKADGVKRLCSNYWSKIHGS